MATVPQQPAHYFFLNYMKVDDLKRIAEQQSNPETNDPYLLVVNVKDSYAIDCFMSIVNGEKFLSAEKQRPDQYNVYQELPYTSKPGKIVSVSLPSDIHRFSVVTTMDERKLPTHLQKFIKENNDRTEKLLHRSMVKERIEPARKVVVTHLGWLTNDEEQRMGTWFNGRYVDDKKRP